MIKILNLTLKIKIKIEILEFEILEFLEFLEQVVF